MVGETASDAVSVPVTRYASVRSVKKKRTTAVITMVHSDPAPVRVQVRVKRVWTTVVTVPQGAVNVRV